MLKINKLKTENDFQKEGLTKGEFIDFLYNHLGKFGDTKDAIEKSINYAFERGGFLLTAYYEDNLVGTLVINDTHMSGFIPEHVLVYVAVDGSYRNKGFGRQIVEKAIELCDGDVKLHVEYDNPAKRLYERLGFTSKYAEMRFNKKES